MPPVGGWMTYQRVRRRNGLLPRKPDDDPDPYWRSDRRALRTTWAGVVGDLDRMERDYLRPAYPEPPFALRPQGSDPSARVAEKLGIDVEIVRAVLREVFLGKF